jgi:heme exporter protein CcmD
MSNWYYVGLAYGITYFVLAGYAVYLIRRRARAQHALETELHRQED